VFDWDSVIIERNFIASISINLNLCAGYLPCAIDLRGGAHSVVEVMGSGSLLCLSSSGCSKITIDSLSFTCRDQQSSYSLFKIQGSTLKISNSTFSDCKSETDGGVIQSYDYANVLIASCRFQSIRSGGYGGAVAAFGCNLSITDSVFFNCSSQAGGGAVWSSVFQDCYGSSERADASLSITSSVFDKCSTEGPGGALLANSGAADMEVLVVGISSTKFSRCSAGGGGGALQASGFVKARIWRSECIACYSAANGGAVSADGSSSVSLVNCTLNGNTANGLGGGAVHLKYSNYLAYETIMNSNKAPNGGGGALFWQGHIGSARLGCPKGMASASISCATAGTELLFSECIVGTCAFCFPESYQDQDDAEKCVPCAPGTYSEVRGASFCNNCPAGRFSEDVGSSSFETCTSCNPGTFSDLPAASFCSRCAAGKYSSVLGGNSSLVCSLCMPGFYSSLGATGCSMCSTGVYDNSTYFSQQEITDIWQCQPNLAQNGAIGRVFRTGNSTHQPIGSTTELMYWVIAPSGASTIIFSMHSMLTGHTYQQFLVYACQNKHCSPGTLLYLWNFSESQNSLPATVSCPSGVMLIVWISSFDATRPVAEWGWMATYQAKNTSTSRNWQDSFRFISDFIPKPSRISCLRMKSKALECSGIHEIRINSETGVQESMPPCETHGISVTIRSVDQNGPDSQHFHALENRFRLLSQNQANSLQMIQDSISPDTPDIVTNICGSDNSALYGNCIASDFKQLLASQIQHSIFPGLSMNMLVLKKDAYNQTIASDSTSIIQIQPSLNGTWSADRSVLVLGNTLEYFKSGEAAFVFALKPTFAVIDAERGLAKLDGNSGIYVFGSDSQTGIIMRSGVQILSLGQGKSVCPVGYILMPDKPGASSGLAACALCKPGTYSIHPLTHVSGSGSSPTCVNCPSGGSCLEGGSTIHFPVGTWLAIDGIYVLQSCPAGFQLVNSTLGTSKGEFSNNLQQCKPCLPGEYIINPNMDSCQKCPPGNLPHAIKCIIWIVLSVVLGKTWPVQPRR
jgi:hypothetical protein